MVTLHIKKNSFFNFDSKFAIFLIQYHSRELHKSHCLKLIGIFMCCNLFSKIIIWGPYLIRVVPIVNMPMVACCAWYIITLTPCVGQLPMAALIAIDRTISVFFPIWHVGHRDGRYIKSEIRILFRARSPKPDLTGFKLK